jgi:hypothetical protein
MASSVRLPYAACYHILCVCPFPKHTKARSTDRRRSSSPRLRLIERSRRRLSVNARSAECWPQEYGVFWSMDMEHAGPGAQKQPIILNERPPSPYAVSNRRCSFSGVENRLDELVVASRCYRGCPYIFWCAVAQDRGASNATSIRFVIQNCLLVFYYFEKWSTHLK